MAFQEHLNTLNLDLLYPVFSWLFDLIRLLVNHFSNLNCKFLKWLNWSKTSSKHLEFAEKHVFSYLKRPLSGYYVDIGPSWGLEWNRIWTIEMSPNNPKGIPLVLVHGLCSGVGSWVMNLDSLSNNNRKVFAFDVLGFGRSSRPFLSISNDVENCFVESIERWRLSLGLHQKFILLGHGLGGYFSLAYSLHYPENVAHIILVEPWGIPSKQQALSNPSKNLYPLPFWVRLVWKFFHYFNPLVILRLAGPWGLDFIKTLRPDIPKKFSPLFGQRNSKIILTYIFHCNAQLYPTGEEAFRALTTPFGWAKHPLINRINNLSPDIGISFIFGSRSWIDFDPTVNIKYLLGESKVCVNVIHGAGHHVYADKYKEFNDLVNNICLAIDEKLKNYDEDKIEEKILYK